MAGLITHIVFSDKVYETYFSHLLKKEFIIGTSFPDIRYLGVISREATHFHNVSMIDIQNETAFFAGLKFHSLIDEVREKFIIERRIYDIFPDLKYITQSIKILEDILYYDYIKDWNNYINYFDDILNEETEYGILTRDIKKRHDTLQNYFMKIPSQETILESVLSIGLNIDVAYEINKNVSLMKNNKEILSIINDLYKEIEKML